MEKLIKMHELEKAYASEKLKTELKSRFAGGEHVFNISYCDYGGEFYDKVTIEYFKTNHPESIVFEKTDYNGQNAFIFGTVLDKFLRDTEDYMFRFEGLEDLFYKMEEEEREKAKNVLIESLSKKFSFDKEELEEALDIMLEYYEVKIQGLDFCEFELIDNLISLNIITKKGE